jgi:hypothetical protein
MDDHDDLIRRIEDFGRIEDLGCEPLDLGLATRCLN